MEGFDWVVMELLYAGSTQEQQGIGASCLGQWSCSVRQHRPQGHMESVRLYTSLWSALAHVGLGKQGSLRTCVMDDGERLVLIEM